VRTFRGSQRKNEHIPLDVAHIDAIVLSHAHIDHAGRLPFLVRQGYRKVIHATSAVPVVIDSPLATAATGVFEKNADPFDQSEPFVQSHHTRQQALFQFPLLRYTESVEESKTLNPQVGPMVVIAASGMAESRRIRHHLLHGASDPRNTVLIVGFMAENTLGRRIAEKRAVIKLYGEEVLLRAHVEEIHGYSANGGRSEPEDWIDAVRRTSPCTGNAR
jgi:metallo-beta-lactamase family protein